MKHAWPSSRSAFIVFAIGAFGAGGVHCASILDVDHDYAVVASNDAGADAKVDASNAASDGSAATCDGGLCVATVIVPNQVSPGRIVATTDALYWAVGVAGDDNSTSGAVWTSDLTGAAPHAISTGYAVVTDLTATDTTLYFVNAGNGFGDIDSCDLPSCSQKSQTLATSDAAQSIRVAGDVAYWTGSLGGQNGIISCSTTNCSNGKGSVLRATSAAPVRLALSGSELLWSEATSIDACTLPSCTDVPIASEASAGAVFLDDSSAFWLTDESVIEEPVLADAAVTLATGQGAPNDIVVDATNAYWTNLSAGTVSRCARLGCNGAPDVIASGLARPFGVAVTDSAVYVTTQGTGGASATGSIVRILK